MHKTNLLKTEYETTQELPFLSLIISVIGAAALFSICGMHKRLPERK